MEKQNKVNEAILAVNTLTHNADEAERQLLESTESWLGELEARVNAKPDSEQQHALRADLTHAARLLFSMSGRPSINALIGHTLSLLVKVERMDKTGRTVMSRLIPEEVAAKATATPKRVLVINPGSTSTKVGIYDGTLRLHESEVHLNADFPDGAENRATGIVAWMKEVGIEISSLDGIAPRGGFIAPVPHGHLPRHPRNGSRPGPARASPTPATWVSPSPSVWPSFPGTRRRCFWPRATRWSATRWNWWSASRALIRSNATVPARTI